MRALDIKPGDKFGRWTVLSTGYRYGAGNRIHSLCQCECGNTGYVVNTKLANGVSKSCGCLRYLYPTDENGHCLSQTRLHGIWSCMLRRCENPDDKRYYVYGARGITVCDDWHDFMKFREWALANGYDESLSIDRIDVDKGYYPENCRWATRVEQANNTSRNHFITYQGKTLTIAQWGKELGVSAPLISDRLRKGWSEEEALTVSPEKHKPHKKRRHKTA